MSITGIIIADESRDSFYPTPADVADKLLDGIDWDFISSILEPSAGKGDLIKGTTKKYKDERRYSYRDRSVSIDCIEIDPYLRSILDYEFGGTREDELRSRRRILEAKKDYIPELHRCGELTQEEIEEHKALSEQIALLDASSVRIVHDDFLSFQSRKRYDLIVMNPPFSNGDAHLLKAIEMQSRDGGLIRCILNAETLRNPFTNRRRLLAQKIAQYEGKVSFVEGAFLDAERQTDVEIAMVELQIPAKPRDSYIFSRLQKAAEIKEEEPEDITDMSVTDFVAQIVTRFNVEIDAGIELIREYEAMKPYLLDTFEKQRYGTYTTLTVCVGEPSKSGRGEIPNVNKYIRLVRAKYWAALFTNKEFVGKLTSNLREKYSDLVRNMADYDFTEFNIQQIALQMNAEMGQGIQETIVALFEKMTTTHTWFPEIEKTIHYFNGWKTNKAHKIGSKVILPVYGLFADTYWSKETFKVRDAEATISDIEKVFDYLDGNMTACVDLHGVLETACKEGRTKNIHCKYFDVTIYKKGTMHIKFRNQELVERFNIYCCRKKNWLPPNYGKSAYSDMKPEEKEVLDGFHGDGTAGSGESAYQAVMVRSDYFLSEPTREVPALMAPAMGGSADEA